MLRTSPFSFRNSAHLLTVLVIAGSILFGLLGNSGFFLLLWPNFVLNHWMLWQPVTTMFIAPDAMGLIFGTLIIYSIGGSLESWWGKRRFYTVALGIPFAANIATVLIATLSSMLFHELPFPSLPGAFSIFTAIWIAYGLQSWFWGTPLNFWGVGLKGKTFALIGAAFPVLTGLFESFYFVFPQLLTAGFTYLYMYQKSLGDPWRIISMRYLKWKLDRLHRNRKLHVVPSKKEPRGPNDRDDKIIH